MTDLGLIVPSKCEGFGLVTVEGMLNGSLVVGKDTGGTKEQFDNGKSFCGKEIGLRYNTEKDYENKIYCIKDNAHPQRFLLNRCIRLRC